MSNLYAILSISLIVLAYFGTIAWPQIKPYPYTNENVFHHPSFETCSIKHADVLVNCEDAELLNDGNIILSCDKGRRQWNTVMGLHFDSKPRGQLYLYSVETDVVSSLQVDGLEGEFHPLGIAVSDDVIYVVNHRSVGGSIERFRLDLPNLKLKYLSTIVSPHISTPNSLAVYSKDLIYVSNDHGFAPFRHHPILHKLETFLSMPLGYISSIILEGSKYMTDVQYDKIPFANGIAISKNKNKVAIASTTRYSVSLFDIVDGKFVNKTLVKLPFGPDNIRYNPLDDPTGDGDGGFVIAGHARTVQLPAFARDYSKKSPSMIAELNFNSSSGLYDVDVLFRSNGTYYSGSSTGIRDKKRNILLGTSLFDNGVLLCQ